MLNDNIYWHRLKLIAIAIIAIIAIAIIAIAIIAITNYSYKIANSLVKYSGLLSAPK